MAHIRIQDENREISDPAEIVAFLKPFGIQYERWDVAGRLAADATNEQILQTYAPEIERLKKQGGYVTADVIRRGLRCLSAPRELSAAWPLTQLGERRPPRLVARAVDR